MSGDKRDERLPLRWGVILIAAAGVAVFAAQHGGPLAGLGAAIAATGLLFKVLGS